MIYFLGAAVVLTLMPGPDNLFILGQSITKGKNAGISTSLGLCTGLTVHITAATLGISAILYQSALVFSIVKYAGAAYLFYLAYRSFRDQGGPLAVDAVSTFDDEDAGDQDRHRTFRQTLTNSFDKALYKKGVIMNLLNPKVALFFLALLPQFVNAGAGHVAVQMLVLGSIFLLETLVIFVIISLFAGKIGAWLQKSPALSRRMNLVQGLLFTWIGLQIAFSQNE